MCIMNGSMWPCFSAHPLSPQWSVGQPSFSLSLVKRPFLTCRHVLNVSGMTGEKILPVRHNDAFSGRPVWPRRTTSTPLHPPDISLVRWWKSLTFFIKHNWHYIVWKPHICLLLYSSATLKNSMELLVLSHAQCCWVFRLEHWVVLVGRLDFLFA